MARERDTEYFEPNDSFRGRLYQARQIKDYATAGYATLTIRSKETETRYTYKIRQPLPENSDPKFKNKGPIWFVSVLVGSDNENSFEYIGQIRSNLVFDHGQKSWIKADDPRVTAFAWFWHWVRLEKQENVDKVEVWHEGRCAKCGRKLTVPESIESGFGPECARRRGLQRAESSPTKGRRKRKETRLERDRSASLSLLDPSDIED